MLGRQARWQEDLFVAGPLRDLIPDDHILKRVDVVLDLSWLRDEVRGLYNERTGRPGIDPEAAVRQTNAKFERRFKRIEALLEEMGKTPAQSDLAEMDSLWDQAKSEES